MATPSYITNSYMKQMRRLACMSVNRHFDPGLGRGTRKRLTSDNSGSELLTSRTFYILPVSTPSLAGMGRGLR